MKVEMDAPPPNGQLTYTLREIAKELHIHYSTACKLARELDPETRKPRLRTVKIGHKKIVPFHELQRFLEQVS